jgi:hypothetical protein
MRTSATTTERPADTTEALYVYGIVPAGTSVPPLEEAPSMGSGPRVLSDGPVGAVVEAIDPDRPLGRRRDLLAHSTVLNAIAAEGPVLPMRFGAVVQGETAVVEELLRPQQQHFTDLLGQVEGKVQFTLRARYLLDSLLAEVVAADPQVAELRRRTVGLPEDATYYDRIRLGELVARAVDVRREQDSRHLLDVLAARAEAHHVRTGAGMDDLAEISFLVTTEQRSGFEGAAEELAEDLDGRARLSLVGPMALYDFVPEQ